MNFNLGPFKPTVEQIVGITALIKNKIFALFDEMGVGKTKQVVDAACHLFMGGVIDMVVVVAPASVRSVWSDPDLGEIDKHAFVPVSVEEYSSRGLHGWTTSPTGTGELEWVITNYELLRRPERLKGLKAMMRKKRVLLVLDESTAVKNPRAKQTRAIRVLRKSCTRVVCLTGTPVANSPMDLFSPFNIMDPAIIGCKSFYQFRARYALMGGWMGKQIVGYKNMEHLQALIKPYILRRTKADCLDLPEKVYTTRECALSPQTWKIYNDMKEEMVAWLDDGSVATAAQAGVRGMRLSQICSGYLGGIEGEDEARELGAKEKLKAALEWTDEIRTDQNRAAVMWCRFRPELQRLASYVKADQVVTVAGGQKKDERDEAKAALAPGSKDRDTILVANPQAGGMGLNLQRADRILYVSRDHSLTNRQQSEDRCHRRGQDKTVVYTDLIATGPKGERTVDHAIVRALRKKEDVATWTTDQWRDALKGD